jgi:hypothetical protein
MSDDIQKTYREIRKYIKDVEHIDSTETALEVGIHLVRHLPEPFDEQTTEKLNEIADCLNLLANFVIGEARYARILYQNLESEIRKELQE